MEGRIMSKVGEFAAAQGAVNDRIEAGLTGLAGDIANLNAQIAVLQGAAISPEDQAALDGLLARGQALAGKVEALDGLTPKAEG